MNRLQRQTLSLIQSQLARNPLPTLMESEDWELPPTPPPKDARYTSAMDTARVDADSASTPASGSKRKRTTQDFDDTIYERRNGHLEAVNGDQDLRSTQKRPRSNAGGRSSSNYSDDEPVQQRQKGSLHRKRGFANLSNINLRHAASSAFHSESPIRESRFQEGSLNDKPSNQPPSVFTRVARTDSGNLQQVDELMNDYHEGFAAPSKSTEEYEEATIEYEKATIPSRVAEITEQRKKEEGKRGMFRFGKSFTNTFHPVQLWNRMWSDSRDELVAKTRLEAERKAREKADIQARYDQMKRDGQFNTHHVPFAGKHQTAVMPTHDAVMVDDDRTSGQSVATLEISPSQADAASGASNDAREALEASEEKEETPMTTTKSRFSRLHFRTPSISNLRDTFRSVRSVRSHSALSGAVDRDSSASASVSPAKADLSTLKKSISRYDLKKERRLSNRVSDLESKLNKARMELKNALDDASPMPKLGARYERFTPIGTTKRSRFVPGALATLPSERLMFPDMSASDAQGESAREFRPRNTLELNRGTDVSKAFEDIHDEDELQKEPVAETKHYDDHTRTTAMSHPIEVGSQAIAVEAMRPATISNPDDRRSVAANPALSAKLSALEASYKAANKPAKSKKRKSTATIDDEKLYRPDGKDEDSSSEELVTQKKRKSSGKTAGAVKKKSPGKKAMKRTSIPVPIADSKGRKGKKVPDVVETFFIRDALAEDDGDSLDELAPAIPANPDSDVPSLEPVYEEEEEVTTIPLNDVPSKPTAKSTPARYGSDKVHSHSNSPHKKRSDSLQPAVDGQHARAQRRSPPPQGRWAEVTGDTIVAVPCENSVPSLPAGDKNWTWPADVF